MDYGRATCQNHVITKPSPLSHDCSWASHSYRNV